MSAMSEYYAVTTNEWVNNTIISKFLGVTQSAAGYSAKVLEANGEIEIKKLSVDKCKGFFVKRKRIIPVGEGILSMMW